MNKVFKAALSVLVTGLMIQLQWQYFNTEGTGTIFSLEFARTYGDAVAASANWNKGAVIFNIIMDYALLAAYGYFFYITNLSISRLLPGWFGFAGSIIMWFGPAAAFLDGVENLLMLLFITGPSGPEHFLSPFLWAVTKFAAIFIAFMYFLIGSTMVIDAAITQQKKS